MNVNIKNEIQEKILQITVGEEFCFNDIFSEYPSLDDRTKREICYSIYFWLVGNNFVELRQSTKHFSPFDEECLLVMEEKLILKSTKDNFLNFKKLDFEYECASGMPLQSFKISNNYLAYLSPDNELIIIDDPELMKKIYAIFIRFVKKAKRQRMKDKKATGRISKSLWKKKKLFQKVPNGAEMTDNLFNILKQHVKI